MEKIDIYTRGIKKSKGFISWGNWVYECSTNYSKTCKEAKERFLRKENYLSSEQVKAVFAK